MKIVQNNHQANPIQLSNPNNQKGLIDLNKPIICSYLDRKNIEAIKIPVLAATKLSNFQFLLLDNWEQDLSSSYFILDQPNNLFVLDRVSDFENILEFVDLFTAFSSDHEPYHLRENSVVRKIPTLYFDREGNSNKLLGDPYSYVISGQANLDLFLLFIQRFFESTNDDIPKTKQLKIDSIITDSTDLVTTKNIGKKIEEPTKVDYSALAVSLQEQGDLEGAIVNYKKTIELEPNQPAWVYCNIINCLHSLEKFDEAINFGQKGILVCSEVADLYRLLALAYNQKGETHNVIKNYCKAVDCDPEQPFWLYCALIELLTIHDRFDEAIDISRQALALYPDQEDIYYHYGLLLYKINDLESAIEKLEQSVRLKPDHFWSNQLLGEILFKNNRCKESSSFLEQATRIKEDYLWSHYYLGEARLKDNKWKEAVESYQKFLKFQPESTEVFNKINSAIDNLVALSLQKNESEYAQELKHKPNDAELYFGLANIYAKQSRLSKAIALFQMVIKLKPQRLDAQILLQRTLERKKRLYKAFKINVGDNLYGLWLKENLPQPSDLDWMPEIVQSLGHKPLISIIVPTYNPPEQFLREMIQSVLDQIYPNWELCIADDNSSQPHVRETLEEYAVIDKRIKIVFRSQNGHISAASNSALELASGEFITLLDHDDLLTPDALYEVVLLLNRHPEADMIYSDEDKVNEENHWLNPFFKPDWCPDSFLSRMYTCHLGTYRRSIVNQIGGFRLGYEGSQDYDLVLRFTEKTKNIFHIPKILYHWRIHSASAASGSDAKPYAYDAGARALDDALLRRREPGKIIQNIHVPGVYIVRYEIKDHKLVSIIIPTRNLGDVLSGCLKSIFEKSTYPNYEVIIVDNGTDDPNTIELFEYWKNREPDRFKCHSLDIPFNYSRLNNFGVSQAKGDYLLFLNNDTEILSPDWLEALVEQAQRQSIGVVGAKLLYPDDTIQHAGVVLGIGGIAGHSHKHFPKDDEGYIRQLISVNNYSAVTAACLMCRRQVFEQVDGFDETLKVAFNDVDFCLKIQNQGYNNVCLPHVVLYHYESKSRGYEDTPAKQQRFLQEMETIKHKWGDIIAQDPCYSPNLTKNREDYGLNIQTQIEILDVVPAEQNPEKFWGFHIDTPQSGENILGILTLSGWVLGNRSLASQVDVIYEGKVIKTTDVNHLRPDVAQVFAHVPEAEKCGFGVMLDVIGLSREAELLVKVVFEDGSSTSLGRVKLRY